tara:strand:+ start:1209 stop:1916 length:708 start_codon:yes stop_codon:yes gene_type:complete
MTSCSEHKMLSIGHRGAKGYIAENTLESINMAIELNVDGVEIDVFKCLSGELVLFHDKNLKKLTGKSGKIENLTINDLQKYLVLGKYKIPTLKDVLEKIKKPLLVNIELKGSGAAESTSKIIEDFSKRTLWKKENFIVSSFNWDELKKFRSINTDIAIGILLDKLGNINEAIQFGKNINAQSIHPNYRMLNEGTVEKIKKNGFKIYTWTVNNKEDISFMQKLNVDGVISDYPDQI